MEPLSITGLGLVGPLGSGRSAFLHALSSTSDASARAFGVPDALSAERVPDAWAAEAWGFDARQFLGGKGLRNFDRLTKFLIVAAKLALEDGGIKREGQFVVSAPERVGVCSATAYGSLDAITELNLVAELEDPRFLNPNRFPNTVINSASGYVGIWEGLQAPNVTIVDGNCGALDAVISAETHLCHGRADVFLLGGGEVLSEPLYLAFRKLGILAEQGRRFAPGLPESQGMCLGEGAVYLCAERRPFARARGARVMAELAGYGTGFEPPPSEALLVHASKDALVRALAGALQDAGMPASELDAVCCAASGIPRFDQAEAEALDELVGSRVPRIAPKALFGETLGASGAFGLAASLAWFAGAPMAPVLRGKAPAMPRTVAVVTLGYYGNASAVIVRRVDAATDATERAER